MLSRGLYSFQFSNQISELGPDQQVLVRKAGFRWELSTLRLSWAQVGWLAWCSP